MLNKMQIIGPRWCAINFFYEFSKKKKKKKNFYEWYVCLSIYTRACRSLSLFFQLIERVSRVYLKEAQIFQGLPNSNPTLLNITWTFWAKVDHLRVCHIWIRLQAIISINGSIARILMVPNMDVLSANWVTDYSRWSLC